MSKAGPLRIGATGDPTVVVYTVGGNKVKEDLVEKSTVDLRVRPLMHGFGGAAAALGVGGRAAGLRSAFTALSKRWGC